MIFNLSESVKHGHTVPFKTPESIIKNKNIKINFPQYDLDLSGDDIHDVLLQLTPEELDHEKLKLLKSSKNIVDDYKKYISGQIIDLFNKYEDELNSYINNKRYNLSNVNPFVGIVANLYEFYKMFTDTKSLDMADDEFSDFLMYNYFPKEINDPEYVKDLINARVVYTDGIIEIFRSMVRNNYHNLQLTLAEAAKYRVELNGKHANDYIKKVKKHLINASYNSDIVNKFTHTINFKKFGGGVVYCSKNIWITNKEIINIDRLIVRAFNYDVVIYAHGHDENGKWTTEPITPIGTREEFTDVNELLHYLVDNGAKSILLMQCNPGHYKIDKDLIRTDVTIHHSMNETIMETFIDEIRTNFRSALESLNNVYEQVDSTIIFEDTIGYPTIDKWDDCYMLVEDNMAIVKTKFKELLADIRDVSKKVNYIYDKIKMMGLEKAEFEHPIKFNLIHFDFDDRCKILNRAMVSPRDILETYDSVISGISRIISYTSYEQLKLLDNFKMILSNINESFVCIDKNSLYYTVGEALSELGENVAPIFVIRKINRRLYRSLEEVLSSSRHRRNPSLDIYEYYIPDEKIFGAKLQIMVDTGNLCCNDKVSKKLPHCRKIDIDEI